MGMVELWYGDYGMLLGFSPRVRVFSQFHGFPNMTATLRKLISFLGRIISFGSTGLLSPEILRLSWLFDSKLTL